VASEFRAALATAVQIYGEATFRLSASSEKLGNVSRSLYDATMVALIQLFREAGGSESVQDAIRAKRLAIVSRTYTAMEDPLKYRLLRGTSSTKQMTLDRISAVKEILQAD